MEMIKGYQENEGNRKEERLERLKRQNLLRKYSELSLREVAEEREFLVPREEDMYIIGLNPDRDMRLEVLTEVLEQKREELEKNIFLRKEMLGRINPKYAPLFTN
jgi:hypothetical protein